ncbi:MAG TPA: O-antigen ligase family protein [Pyrinomonadaceae bacterium]
MGDAGRDDEFPDLGPRHGEGGAWGEAPPEPESPSLRPKSAAGASAKNSLRPAHAFTFAGLFLFTFVLFYRPYEYIPVPSNLAFWFAVVTLAVFFPSQLAAEGNLTARPREVNLVLLLLVTGLLSIPLAKGSPGEAWATFTDVFIRAVLMFVVIVNAVRTERRLRLMLLLSVGSAAALGAAALYDFRSGRLTVEGYRVEGSLGGMFENPNDMALHLVTMVPVAVARAFGSRGILRKAFYAGAAGLMVAGTIVTYSRAGFLGLAASSLVLAWTLGRRHRFAVVSGAFALVVGLLVLAPGNYGARIFSIYDRSLDAYGSADARQALLMRSVLVAVRNPLFGVGMGNFQYVSFRNQVTHNAYTQVAAEMGAFALVLYALYIVSPLRRLRAVARETFEARKTSRFYYLAAGLAASLVAYMVASFFASVAYYWNVYYLVGYSVCLYRLYEAGEGAAREGAGAKGRAETGQKGEAAAANV